MGWHDDLQKGVCEGEEEDASAAARAALEEGVEAGVVLNAAIEGVYEAGRLWQDDEYFLPDVVLACEAFREVMTMLEPGLRAGTGCWKGRVVIGTVEGDAHDLGKNIVMAMLRASMYEVVDLGVDVPAARFVEAVREHDARVLGLGAYMTTTMRNIEGVVAALIAAGLRSRVKVIVGGAAVTEEYADAVGADGYGEDAFAAVRLADRLLEVS